MLQAILTACEFRKTWQHMGVPSHESGAKTLLIIYSQVLFRIFKVSQKLSRLWVSPSVCVQLMQNQATREVRTMLARVVAQETNMRGNQSKALAVNQRVEPRAWQQSNIKKIKAVKVKNSTTIEKQFKKLGACKAWVCESLSLGNPHPKQQGCSLLPNLEWVHQWLQVALRWMRAGAKPRVGGDCR
jgi:hypothetical protein